MDGVMLGIAVLAFVLVLSPRLGWDAGPARLKMLVAAVLYGLSIALPTFALLGTTRETGWAVAGGIAGAAGAVVTILAVLDLRRA